MVNSMGDMKSEAAPLVSISVLAYNHEKYIRQCLDSILMQEVDFPYEVLIHDDASPDGTADIIREYEAKHPEIIKPIYQIENQYSQKNCIDLFNIDMFNIDRARGKYLAFCDGDDYWLDPKKLQTQVDFLEKRSEYIACVHRTKVIDEFGNVHQSAEFPPGYDTRDYTLSDAENLLVGNGCAGHHSSLICRNIFMNLPKDIYTSYLQCKANGDIKLFLLLTLNGRIRRFADTMSVYRYITSGGTSWSAGYTKMPNTCLLAYNRLQELSQFSEMSYGYIPDYTDFENKLALVSLYRLITHPNEDNWNTTRELFTLTKDKFRLLAYIPRFTVDNIVRHL